MTRRKFIGLALAMIITVVVVWPLLGDFDRLIRRILFQELSKAKMNTAVLDQFVRDARKDNLWNQFTFGKKLLIRFHFFFDNSIVKLPYHHKYLHYKNLIVEEFLMSTDLVLNGMDPRREIKYVGLFNPYKRYCFNPFSDVFNP
jgi:hypothetical protein